MNRFILSFRTVTTIVLIIFCLMSLSSTYSQSALNAVELWHYEYNTSTDTNEVLTGLAVTRDGSRVALGYYSGKLVILDGETGDQLHTLQIPNELRDIEMVWSPSGEQLSIADENLLIWSFQPDGASDLIRIDEVTNVSWSPQGILAVSSIYDLNSELRFIDGTTGEEISSRTIPGLGVARWSPDGNYIALYRSNPPSDDMTTPQYQIDVLDVDNNSHVTIGFPDGAASPSNTFVWLPDSSGLISYAGGALWRWDMNLSDIETIVPASNENMVNQRPLLSINRKGNLLAVVNPNNNAEVQIIDIRTGIIRLKNGIPITRTLFEWGGDDMLYIYDDMLRAYQISVK